jgi:hypothetical protein
MRERERERERERWKALLRKRATLGPAGPHLCVSLYLDSVWSCQDLEPNPTIGSRTRFLLPWAKPMVLPYDCHCSRLAFRPSCRGLQQPQPRSHLQALPSSLAS